MYNDNMKWVEPSPDPGTRTITSHNNVTSRLQYITGNMQDVLKIKFNQLATITVATIATFTYRTAVAAKILWHTLHLFYFKLKIREALWMLLVDMFRIYRQSSSTLLIFSFERAIVLNNKIPRHNTIHMFRLHPT